MVIRRNRNNWTIRIQHTTDIFDLSVFEGGLINKRREKSYNIPKRPREIVDLRVEGGGCSGEGDVPSPHDMLKWR